jgi:hypothetical protein
VTNLSVYIYGFIYQSTIYSVLAAFAQPRVSCSVGSGLVGMFEVEGE